jgi:hypothetical protein
VTLPTLWLDQHHPRGLHEQNAQVAIAALREQLNRSSGAIGALQRWSPPLELLGLGLISNLCPSLALLRTLERFQYERLSELALQRRPVRGHEFVTHELQGVRSNRSIRNGGEAPDRQRLQQRRSLRKRVDV